MAHIDIPGWSDFYATTGFARRTSSGEIGGGDAASSGSQNDYIEWEVYVEAGTWDLSIMYNRGTSRGIATIALDGTTLGTIDMYATLNTKNIVSTISGFTVATAGIYPLRVTMGDKHASSSAYYGYIQWISLDRTGA